MDFLGTLMPPTLSKRAAAMLLLVAGLGNEEVTELTGMCIRSVRALRKVMEEQEPTYELFAIKLGSGRKRKTEVIEEAVFAELDKGIYNTNQKVADMLKEKFGIKASVNLASRLVKRWRAAREEAEGQHITQCCWIGATHRKQPCMRQRLHTGLFVLQKRELWIEITSWLAQRQVASGQLMLYFS